MQPLVPPEESQRIGPVEHPGIQITGGSVRDANDSSLLRVPTVYAPFRSGSVFDFGEHSGEGPGATLRLANVTFVMENVTWYDLVGGRSGLRPFFNLQQDARFCLTNRCGARSLYLCAPSRARASAHCTVLSP